KALIEAVESVVAVPLVVSVPRAPGGGGGGATEALPPPPQPTKAVAADTAANRTMSFRVMTDPFGSAGSRCPAKKIVEQAGPADGSVLPFFTVVSPRGAAMKASEVPAG